MKRIEKVISISCNKLVFTAPINVSVFTERLRHDEEGNADTDGQLPACGQGCCPADH